MSRRRERGSVYEYPNGSGSFYASVSYRTPDGKRHRPKRGPMSRPDAEETADILVLWSEAWDARTTPPPGTTASYLEAWLEDACDLAPKTREVYRTAVRHNISPCIGHLGLDELTHDDVQGMVSRLRRVGLGRDAAAQAKRVLAAALKEARRQGLVATADPTEFVEVPA
jgi:hypothetical protein